MLRVVTLAVVVSVALSAPQSNFIFKNDITPEEAQEYLKSLPFIEPKLSGKTATLPLVRYDSPSFRAAEAGPTLGHYWKNGHEIENTDDYVEEVYNAAQYHGQDGLGAYAYGYETPESAKVEDRRRSGEVQGQYIYKSPGREPIKVRYWADSQGFHQEDNLPKVELKPAEETPALRDARLAFEKAWKEAADANSKQPTLPPNYYDPYQTAGSAQQETYVALEQPREGKAAAYGQQQQYQQNQYQQQQYQQQQPQYNQQQQYSQQQQYNQPQQQQYSQQQQYNQQYGQGQKHLLNELSTTTTEEPTGPPHGFFYSFEYPVSIIKNKNEKDDDSYPVDHDTVGINHQ